MQENNENIKIVRTNKKQKSMVTKIFDVVISVIVFGVLGAWLFDFYNVYTNKEPKLCIKKEHHDYEDGSTNVCTGLGYKVYEYNRESIEGVEFSPFWAKERK